MTTKRLVIIFVGIFIICLNSYGQFSTDFNKAYILGKWTFQYGLTVENGDTIPDPIIAKVFYDFKENGLLTFKLASDSLNWSIDSRNYQLLIEALNSKGEKQIADYKIDIKCDSIFNISRSYKGRTFIYHFTNGWENN